MSESIKREYSFTVRLSADEKAELEALAEHYALDKSATVRKALQQAQSPQLPERGQFAALHREGVTFAIRLNRKGADE